MPLYSYPLSSPTPIFVNRTSEPGWSKPLPPFVRRLNTAYTGRLQLASRGRRIFDGHLQHWLAVGARLSARPHTSSNGEHVGLRLSLPSQSRASVAKRKKVCSKLIPSMTQIHRVESPSFFIPSVPADKSAQELQNVHDGVIVLSPMLIAGSIR